jgi:phage terminase large subunit-like protein
MVRCGYDSWLGNEFIKSLLDFGIDMVPVRQGFRSMSAPIAELKTMVLQKKAHHGGNPILEWMVSNVVVECNSLGDIKPTLNSNDIDGVLAMLRALYLYIDSYNKKIIIEGKNHE